MPRCSFALTRRGSSRLASARGVSAEAPGSVAASRLVGAAGVPGQAAAGLVVCRWSLSRLPLAVISRHFERQADLPRR